MKRLSLVIAAAAFYCLSAVPAHADSVPACTPGTSIAQLQSSGGCSAGELFFSNFVYNNSGLQLFPGIFVTPANVLATATPSGVTFSTNYGVGGAFSNCTLPSGATSGNCIEEEGAIGYDVSVIRGNRKIDGLTLTGGIPGGGGGVVSEIACLGPGNPAHVLNASLGGYILPEVAEACPVDPSNAVALNVRDWPGPNTPRSAVFSPVSSISFSLGLDVSLSPASVTPFSNAFLLVPEPSSLMLLIPGLLALIGFKLKKVIA
jgi:hypothetical protein